MELICEIIDWFQTNGRKLVSAEGFIKSCQGVRSRLECLSL